MKNIDELPEELFDLFTIGDFRNLNEDQKQVVLQHINVGEFDAYAAIVCDFQVLDSKRNTDLPKPTHTPKGKSRFTRVLNYRMPLYQVAASLAICILATTVMYKGSNKINGTPTDSTIETVGVSLANDDYPAELIFDL